MQTGKQVVFGLDRHYYLYHCFSVIQFKSSMKKSVTMDESYPSPVK